MQDLYDAIFGRARKQTVSFPVHDVGLSLRLYSSGDVTLRQVYSDYRLNTIQRKQFRRWAEKCAAATDSNAYADRAEAICQREESDSISDRSKMETRAQKRKRFWRHFP